MKRVLLLTTAILIVFAAMQLCAYAGPLEDATGLTIIATDDFNAEDGTAIVDYTGGTGWAPIDEKGSWYKNVSSVDVPQTTGHFTVKDGSFTPSGTTGGGGYTAMRKLNKVADDENPENNVDNYIYMNSNMDYYYKITSVPFDAAIAPFTLNNSMSFNFGFMRVAEPASLTFSAGIKTNHATASFCMYGPGSGFCGREIDTTKPYTWIIRIAARTTGEDTISIKAFAEGEAVTYTPDGWDMITSLNSSDIYDRFAVRYGNGAGNNNRKPRFDDIVISKRAPVYTDITGGTFTYAGPVVGETITVSVDPVNPITGAEQSITECKWYLDGSETEFSSDLAVTLDTSHIGRRLICKVTVQEGTPANTLVLYPIDAYVRDYFDVASGIINNAATGNSTNRVTVDADGELDENSAMAIQVVISKNKKEVAGAFTVLFALYDSSGALKRLLAKGESTSLVSHTQKHDYYTFKPPVFPAGTFAKGDYVRYYVWDSITGVRPLATNKNVSLLANKFPQ